MTELVRTLCSLDGVTGDEDRVRAFIKEQAAPWADSIRTDALGNLIVFKRGARSTGQKLMLCAHMDEAGLMITEIGKGGFLRFGLAGSVDRRTLTGRAVRIGPDRVYGVVGTRPYHLMEKKELKRVPKVRDLYIDIGAGSREEAEQMVSPGDTAAFATESEDFGEGLLKAKALDDRAGCAVMLELLKEDLPLDVTFVFTAMEEAGSRGAFGAAFSVSPEYALVLDAAGAWDLPCVPPQRQVCGPGGGPVLPYMDSGTVYDRGLFEMLRDLADRNGIPWQTREYLSGDSGGGAVQRSRAGVRAAAVAAAVRCIHAPAGIASTADFENILKLVRLFLVRMADSV